MGEYDYSVFKILSSNDTSAAIGHQGGIVIPKDIAIFFPPLPDASKQFPTTEQWLTADLFDGDTFLRTVATRFQHQTWGGERPPERRLTSNLGPIRDLASAGDIVLFFKDTEDLLRMKLTLLRSGMPRHTAIVASQPMKRWGLADRENVPIKSEEYLVAESVIEKTSHGEFNGFDPNRILVQTRTARLARSAAFRSRILALYDRRCAFSNRVIRSPTGSVNVDAAHIISVQRGGSDDLRNGIALSKDLHWAFDQGLITVDQNRKLMVSKAQNAEISVIGWLDGHPITEASQTDLQASDSAFAWHRDNCFVV